MKNTLLKLYFTGMMILLGSCCLQAQSTKEFTADGIKVLLKSSPKQVVSARLFIRGGTSNYPKAKQGIEQLAFTIAMNDGTTKMNKNDFNTEAENLGTSFGSSSGLDYGNLSMTCIKDAWDNSWDLFTDAILNPAFDETEFKKEKEKMVTYWKNAQSNPDAMLTELAMNNAFENRNYAKQTGGTETTLQKIGLEETKTYYKNTVCKAKSVLVIVGDISEEEIRAKIKTSLSKLPLGRPINYESRTLITKTSEKIVDRKIATNYLIGIMSAPLFNSPDGMPMTLAFSILYDRFFVELRTKRSLSYAPAAYYARNAVSSPYSAIYISTTKPKEAIAAMVNVIDSVKINGLTEKELKDQKESFLTGYYMKQETAAAQSQSLGMAEMNGNWKIDENYNDMVKAATLKQVNDVLKKYTNAIAWTYLGKKEMIKVTDFKQSKKVGPTATLY